ncbi:MAG TPA: hypothetical protein VNJ51_14420 [Candidatus Dormibacteraeota bacterium]|nr:hypothetical protein [Candidatus Dormibacteraeota bacterium]
MTDGRLDDRDRLTGALIGAALGEALSRLGDDGSAAGTATLEQRLRADRWSLGPGVTAALAVGEGVLGGGLDRLPAPLRLHGTGDHFDLLPVLPVALSGAFDPGHLRERAAALYARGPRETAEAAIAFALLLAALFDGDRLAALDEASEAAPAAVGIAIRSAPLEDASRLSMGSEPLRSLTGAVWAFYQADEAVQALLISARLGLGPICGGLCGALSGAWWGRSGIPAELAHKMEGRGLAEFGERLANHLAGATNCRRREFHG